MEPFGLSVTQLAERLAVFRKTISKIVNGGGAVTPDMALRLAAAFGTSPQLWLNLQQNCDLWQAAHESKDWKHVSKIAA
jgi:addiction module HigA family antidote